MRGFKHVPAEFADAFASGASIQLGTFSYYREMESDRADRLEGIAETIVGGVDMSSSDPDFEDKRTMLARFGIHIKEGAHIGRLQIGSNTHRVQLADAYLFCCSDQPDENYIKAGQACFEITAMRRFAQLLTAVRPDELEHPTVRRVIYEERSRKVEDGPSPVSDPFRKNAAFRHEREIRIAWKGDNKRLFRARTLILSCPQAAEFIKRVA